MGETHEMEDNIKMDAAMSNGFIWFWTGSQ
jgi:hypothetical protein